MKNTILLSATLLFTQISAAALPPYYNSAREIKAILDSEQVYRQLGIVRSIDSITRYENGYSVSAGDCAVNVGVKYLPTRMIGAGQFELQVGLVTCLPR